MGKRFVLKLIAIGLVQAVLLIGLWAIHSVMEERRTRRDTAVQDIASSSSLEQRLAGPLLVVPFTRKVAEWTDETDGRGRHLEEREVEGRLYLMPDTLTITGDLPTERRSRGIYEARLYHAALTIQGEFNVPANYGINSDLDSYRFGTPFISLGISDIRGVESAPSISLDGVQQPLLAGSGSQAVGSGIHAAVPAALSGGRGRWAFSMTLALLGTSSFHVVPAGRTFQMTLRSDWMNPAFTGDYLPVQREVGIHGFSARWATSLFATNLEESLGNCGELSSTCEEFHSKQLGVSFVDPVDQYLKTERAIKYALLFLSLTFAVFFLYEVLHDLELHPVQYALVGAALTVFYLLLLSLAEHIGFPLAYGISSAACVGLIGFYVTHALRSVGRGLGLSAGIAALYGLLYVVLGAEDYALLLGAILIFVVLAAFMILTRRLDWFRFAGERTMGAG